MSELIEVGDKCRVVQHHLQDLIGKFVVIDRFFMGNAWCWEVRPVRFKKKRNGDWQLESDPRSCLSIYSLDELELVEKGFAIKFMEELNAKRRRGFY